MNKGISPLIATIILVSIVFSIIGISLPLINDFIIEETTSLNNFSDNSIKCSFGSIQIKNFSFENSKFIGIIENKGNVILENIIFNVVYEDKTVENIHICLNNSTLIKCSDSNLKLNVSDKILFNILSNKDQYNYIKISTNCPNVNYIIENNL